MLGKDYRVPREIDESDLVFDARPKTAQQAAEEAIQDMKEIPEPIGYQYDLRHQNVPEHERYEPRYYDDQKYASRRTPIDEIAMLVRDLTYGEMVELAGELWACRGDGIEEQSLPETLHRWAKTKQ